MASNAEVTYVDIALNSVPEYWSQLVAPDVAELLRSPSPRGVFQAALSVWHLHDWVWHDRNPGKNSRGTEFEIFRNGLIASCPQLAWLRDIADASKHRGLGRLPEVKAAEPRHVGGGFLYLTGRVLPPGKGALKFFLVLSGDRVEEMESVLRAAVEFWRSELPAHGLSDPFVQWPVL
jgi:hypothetical protein